MTSTPYTDADAVLAIVGQLGLDLRSDDAEPADLMERAIDHGTQDVDFYCSRYSAVELAANTWVNLAATWSAVRYWCLHRLNEVPKSIETEWETNWLPKLVLVQAGKANVPRAATSRRPITVTNTHVDLQRYNGQVRVDRSRSTGVAKDYRRPVDDTAPDGR